MKTNASYANSDGNQVQVRFDLPKACPVCNLLMTVQTHGVTFNPSTSELQVMFLCSNGDCKSYFIGYYIHTETPDFEAVKVEPPNLTQPYFPEFVKEISPTFLKIYRQAHEAKQRELDHVAGPGYRKAFEFLIKDYAKSIDISKSDEIDKSFAGDVVNKFISDVRVQAVAKRALWLGNDEVHYIRKWIDFDVNDLINLIQLTIDWIEIERESKTYVDLMTKATETKAADA